MTENIAQFNPQRLVDRDYLCAEDFGFDGIPEEPRFTISHVEIQITGRKWKLLHFKEQNSKPLKLISTHVQALSLMFDGDDYRKWSGKRVDLHKVRGNFRNGKRTAVRIRGSPDITRAISFQMQQFGSRNMDSYTLHPTGAADKLGPGVVRFGKQSGAYGKPFEEFDDTRLEQLMKEAHAFLEDPKNAKSKFAEDLRANAHEIFDELKRRVAERTPSPEPMPEEEGPAL